MDKKKLSLVALVSTALIVLLSVLENLVLVNNTFSAVTPLLFLLAFICGYFVFKDDTSFVSKWVWVVLAIFFTEALSSTVEFIVPLFRWLLLGEGFEFWGMLTILLNVVGMIGLFLTVLHKKFKKFMPIAFGAFVLGYIGLFFLGASSLSKIVFYALLAVMAFGRFPKLGKFFRFLVIVLALIIERYSFDNLYYSSVLGSFENVYFSSFFFTIACVILAFLLVPGWKWFKINASRLVAILCIITLLVSLGAVLSAGIFSDVSDVAEDLAYSQRMYDQYESARLKERIAEYRVDFVTELVPAVMSLIPALLAFAALILLAICLFKSQYGKHALYSLAGLAGSSLIYMFLTTQNAGRFGFDLFNFPIFKFFASPYLWSIVTLGLLAVIVAEKAKCLKKIRTLAVLTMLITVVLAVVAELEVAIPIFILFALTLIFTSYILVPVVFPEYNGIGKHIFLSLITVGIWQLLWVYNVTKNLNKASCDNRKPLAELLLCMFLPFYYIYWVYKTAEITAVYGADHGQQFKIDIVCLAFTFVCPLVPSILIQDKINRIVGKPE